MKTCEERITSLEATMFDNATLNQLHELRLSAMAHCFTEQQARTDIHSLSFEERFALLVEAEWLCRRNKRTERLVRQAGFRFPAAIEDIDYHNKKGIGKPEVCTVPLLVYQESPECLFLRPYRYR